MLFTIIFLLQLFTINDNGGVTISVTYTITVTTTTTITNTITITKTTVPNTFYRINFYCQIDYFLPISISFMQSTILKT